MNACRQIKGIGRMIEIAVLKAMAAAGATADMIIAALEADRAAEAAANPVSVYGLIDPRTDAVFYIGISSKPERRFSRHLSDDSSAAHHIMNEVQELGLRVELKIFEMFPTRAEAIELETNLIRTMPGLTNVAGRLVQ